MTPDQLLQSIRFKGQLRPSQQEVVDIARRKLADGSRQLHIVAPPGSGKTVLGLYLWAECLKCPALVLSPNSAIQSQWAARTTLFEIDGRHHSNISTDPTSPGLLTSLTYQSVTLPRAAGDDIDQLAVELWIGRLVAKGQAKDPDEATVWIEDLEKHNPSYHNERLGTYRKRVRDARAHDGNALDMLHGSSRATLERLRDKNLGLIILDECHHLMGHWGRVLADVNEFLGHPVVIGLTATPPDRTGKLPQDVERYDNYFGPIDYEVPVPAVVKDGFLAPYQDLAYFVRPTSDELSFIAGADDQLHQLVEELCEPHAGSNANSDDDAQPDEQSNEPPTELGDELSDELMIAQMSKLADELVNEHAYEPAGEGSGDNADDDSIAAGTEETPALEAAPPLPDWLFSVLEELRLPTGVQKDWKTFERRDPEFALAARLFLLHRQIELPADVPVPEIDFEPDDVPELSVLVPVLDRYVRHRLRRSRNPEDHRLADRAVGRMRMLGVQITETGCRPCASPAGRVMAYSKSKIEAMLPILKTEWETRGESLRAVVVADYEKTSAVTADVSHLLDDEAGGAIAAFKTLLSDPVTDALDPVLVTGSCVLVDDDLAPKLEEHATAWLIANDFNVKLSFDEQAGFHVLNGRGADWCPRVYVAMITELFQQGVTRCLVGTRGLLGEGWDANKINVLLDLTTVTTSMSVNQLRGRSIRIDPDDPDKLANNWDVVCIAPEFSKGLDDYSRFIKKHKTIFGITDDGAIEKGVGHVHPAFTELKPEGVEGSVGLLNKDMLDRAKRYPHARDLWRIGEPYHAKPIRALEVHPISERQASRFPPFRGAKTPWTPGSLTLAVGNAVLGALTEAGLIQNERSLHVGDRAGGYVRAFLEDATEEESELFTQSLYEVFAPLHRPRYVIPRRVDRDTETLLSRLMPSMLGRYFRRRKREIALWHAVPTVIARNKEMVKLFERYWNAHVSPGQALYAHRGAGEEQLERARRQGQVSRGGVHQKEIFV